RLVQAFLDNLYLGVVSYGIERPDVAAAFPAEAPLKCGYTERFWLDRLGLSGQKVLSIIAYDERGNRQAYTRTITLEAVKPAAVLSRPEQREASGLVTQASLSKTDMTSAAMPETSHEIEAVIAEFRERTSREPSLLDWNSGLNLEGLLPNLPICTFRSADT